MLRRQQGGGDGEGESEETGRAASTSQHEPGTQPGDVAPTKPILAGKEKEEWDRGVTDRSNEWRT